MATLLLVWPRLSRVREIPFIFLVSPGTAKDVRGYFRWPVLATFARRILPLVFPIGFLGRGVVFGTFFSAEEMERSPELSRAIHAALALSAERIHARSIALAGRAPGIFLRHGLNMASPFTTGDKGTVHTVTQAVVAACLRHRTIPNPRIVIMGGAGFIGREVLRHLQQLGFSNVLAFDTPDRVAQHQKNIPCTADPSQLVGAEIAVILTARGDQIAPYTAFLAGAIVLDDTHPQLPRRIVEDLVAHGCQTHKVSMTVPGLRFMPAIPGYRSYWIPGCAWQAVVIAIAEVADRQITTHEEFDLVAREIGYRVILAPHYYGNYR